MIDFLRDTTLYLQRGGWVMAPLIVFSVAMWALILDRARAFRRMTAGDLSIRESVRAIRGEPVPVGGDGMRSTLVRRFLAERAGIVDIDREILRQCVLGVSSATRRFLAIIAVLAAVAPLLGLLGTVLGMIQTFNVISLFGTGNAKAMASGISVALITTQMGLLIAIPGLFISGMLIRQASRMRVQLEETVVVLDRAIRQAAG